MKKPAYLTWRLQTCFFLVEDIITVHQTLFSNVISRP